MGGKDRKNQLMCYGPLPEMKAFQDHPYVLSREDDDLVLYSYSRQCIYDQAWDDITLSARGVIFNKRTGELIARPFRKFFNLLEKEETQMENLPDCPFTVTDKLDGSLGIYYTHKGEHFVTTKGTLRYVIGDWATDWFRKNVRVDDMRPDYTYLFEILSKINRIVIDYGDREELVLIGAVEKSTGRELPYTELCREAEKMGISVVTQVTGFKNIRDLHGYCKGLGLDHEGFVVTFENGLKIKMKADEYLKVHRMLSYMTPLMYWRAWDIDMRKIPDDFLVGMPEEFRGLSDSLRDAVQDLHDREYRRLLEVHRDVLSKIKKPYEIRYVAEVAKRDHPKDSGLITSLHKHKDYHLWRGIHLRVRPTNNDLPDDPKFSRLRRILQDG